MHPITTNLIGKGVGARHGACDSGMGASTTAIVCADLAGFGEDYFNTNYYMYIVKNANSVGNAPSGQIRQVSNYVTATGTFTVTAFGANVEENDEILILHEIQVLATADSTDNIFPTDVIGNKTDAAVTTVGVIASITAYIKGILNQLATLVARNPRGELEVAEDGTAQDFFQTLINITGSGKFYWMIGIGAGGSDCNVRITIDGYAFTCTLGAQGVGDSWLIYNNAATAGLSNFFTGVAATTLTEIYQGAAMLNIDYQDGLKIEYLSSDDVSSVTVKAAYSVD